MGSRFDSFIEELASVPPTCNVTNQYAFGNEANSIRRVNLRLYLEQMSAMRPAVLLVGEAPGYRGCRLTGVPFTSEFTILRGGCNSRLFGEANGYRKTSESARVCKEQSATIVWETLARLPKIPLLWNAFPFHPHRPGNEQSNRMPTSQELKIGAIFLGQLLCLFNIETVVALGNTTEASVRSMGIDRCKIRHPANGGKRGFVEGVLNTLGNR